MEALRIYNDGSSSTETRKRERVVRKSGPEEIRVAFGMCRGILESGRSKRMADGDDGLAGSMDKEKERTRDKEGAFCEKESKG